MAVGVPSRGYSWPALLVSDSMQQQIHEAFGAQILIYVITATCPDQFVVISTHHETSTTKCAACSA